MLASSCWVGVRGRLALAANCVAHFYIDSLLTTPMREKRGEEGIGMCMCVRMRVIAEGKISLLHVVVSW